MLGNKGTEDFDDAGPEASHQSHLPGALHGLGLAQYDQPVISRIWSLDHPQEIEKGMVFALETQHGKMHDFGVRLEEMLVVTETGHEMLSTFKSHEIIVTD